MGQQAGGVPASDMPELIAHVRQLWRDAGDDLLYQELWATYAVLGERFGADPVTGTLDEYAELMDRLIRLGEQIDRRFEQRFVAALSRQEMSGGDV